MPQGALAVAIGTKNPTGSQAYLGNGGEIITGGASKSALNVTAPAVIKVTPGRIARILVLIAPTTSGALTINDCATTGAATTANQVFTLAYGSVTAGLVIELDFPVAVGLVVSAVGGGTPQYSISYS